MYKLLLVSIVFISGCSGTVRLLEVSGLQEKEKQQLDAMFFERDKKIEAQTNLIKAMWDKLDMDKEEGKK